MVEYGSRCQQREGLAHKAHPLKKSIDRLHIPPYLSLSREDDDDIRDIRKHDFIRFYLILCYLMLNLISINLLVVYRESVNLIGYITRRLSADSQQL